MPSEKQGMEKRDKIGKGEEQYVENNIDSKYLSRVWHLILHIWYILSPHNNLTGEVSYYFISQMRNKEFEDLPKAIQLVSGRTGIQIQEAWCLHQEIPFIHLFNRHYWEPTNSQELG